MDTLIVKTKGSVTDASLPRFGDLVINFSIPANYAPAAIFSSSLFQAVSGKSLQFTVEGAQRVDSGGNPSASGDYISAGVGKITLYNKYDLETFKFALINWGNGKYLWLDDIAELAYCTSIETITLGSQGTTGNIESLVNLKKLTSFSANKSNVGGDLLTLFRGLIESGWYDDALLLPNIGQWNNTASIKFNNKLVNSTNFPTITSSTSASLRISGNKIQFYNTSTSTVIEEVSI